MNRQSSVRRHLPAKREELPKIRKQDKFRWHEVLWQDTLWLMRYFYRTGKIVAIVASMISALLLITPKISVTPGINIDPMDTFPTNFAIKNEGHVPIYNLEFSCNINAAYTFSNVRVTNSPVSELWPGSTATRNCAVMASGVPTPNVKIDAFARYWWPFFIWSSMEKIHFEGKHGKAGYFLVPDVVD
jgi:hypothetical protein